MLALPLLLAVAVAPPVPSATSSSEEAAAAADATSKTHIIFLDRDGAILHPGTNDSRAETSSLVPRLTSIAPWKTTDANWSATMACMRAMWAPFDIDVTDVDPGTNVPHVQAVLGGLPADLGFAQNIAGVSPMRTDCGVIESSIAFAFPSTVNDNAQIVCEVISQEIGHSFGLDHELDAADPMTYLPRTGPRTFQANSVSCGEFSERPCGNTHPACRADQSSYDVLMTRIGPARTAPDTGTSGKDDAGSGSNATGNGNDNDNGFGEPAGCSASNNAPSGPLPSATVVALALLAAAVARRRAQATRRRGTAG